MENVKPNSWIEEQIHSGKKDEEITETLIKNGWHLKDAQQAVSSARKPHIISQLTRKEIITFIIALVGIFLFILTSPLAQVHYEGYDWISSLINSAIEGITTIAALLFLSWTLYHFSLRHQHPKLHKLFFLCVSSITGIGYFLWAITIVMFVLILSQFTITTITAICILSVFFSTTVIGIEYIYSYLKHQYEETPIRSLKRLAVIGIALFVISIICLIGTAWWAENALIKNIGARIGSLMDEAEPISSEDIALLENIENPILRRESPTVLMPLVPPVTIQEVLDDTAISARCDWWIDTIFPPVLIDLSFAKKYQEFKMANQSNETIALEDHQILEEYQIALQIEQNRLKNAPELISLIRYPLLDDIHSCQKQLRNNAQNARTHPFPLNPDISDPAQRDLALFLLWLEEENTRLYS